MTKEGAFLIYCLERYRHAKGLSGKDAADFFDERGIAGYITRYFESLHTTGDDCIIKDIDEFAETQG